MFNLNLMISCMQRQRAIEVSKRTRELTDKIKVKITAQIARNPALAEIVHKQESFTEIENHNKEKNNKK